jgi:hypothetical protein
MMAIPWGGRYLKCRPKRQATDDAWAFTARRYSLVHGGESMTQRPGGNEIPGIRGRLQSPLTAMACNVRGDGLDGSEGGEPAAGVEGQPAGSLLARHDHRQVSSLTTAVL